MEWSPRVSLPWSLRHTVQPLHLLQYYALWGSTIIYYHGVAERFPEYDTGMMGNRRVCAHLTVFLFWKILILASSRGVNRLYASISTRLCKGKRKRLEKPDTSLFIHPWSSSVLVDFATFLFVRPNFTFETPRYSVVRARLPLPVRSGLGSERGFSGAFRPFPRGGKFRPPSTCHYPGSYGIPALPRASR